MSPSQCLWWFWISVPDLTRDFAGGTSGKEPTANAGDAGDKGLIPGLG